MAINRRDFIAAGAATALTTALPGRVFAAPAQLQPRVDSRLMKRALAALAAKRRLIANADVIGIADFDRASRDPRFYIVDLRSGFTTEHLVAHGRGSDPGHSGWLEQFSNEPGSEATSEGAYLVGEPYSGKYGWSLRLTGLDPSNSNADARAIVVHSAWYAEPEMIRTHGKLGRSEGCFALPGISHAEAATRLGPGRMLYAEKLDMTPTLRPFSEMVAG